MVSECVKSTMWYENTDSKSESTYRPVYLTQYLLNWIKDQSVKRKNPPGDDTAAGEAAGRIREERTEAVPRFHPTAAGREGGKQERPKASSRSVSPYPTIAASAAAGHERMSGREPLRRCKWERNRSTRSSVP